MENPLFMVIFQFIFFAVILAVVYFIRKQQSKALMILLEQQALKRNALVNKGGLFSSYPRLSLIHEGLEVVVRSVAGGRNRPPYTYIECKFDSPKTFSMSISGKLSLAGLAKVFGGQDIIVNNPAFDDAFVVRGSDEMIVRNFLSPDVQEKFLNLKESKSCFSIKKNKFELHVPMLFKSEQQYDDFIEMGLALLSQTQATG